MTFPWRIAFGLAGAAAIAGVFFGWRIVNLSETDVITAAAARHVAAGGRTEDCAAVPGTPPVWITVVCAGTPPRIFQANRLGQLTEVAPADVASQVGA